MNPQDNPKKPEEPQKAQVKIHDPSQSFKSKPRGAMRPKLIKLVVYLLLGAVAYVLIIRNFDFVGGFPVLKKKEIITEKADVAEISLPVKAYKIVRMDFTDNLPALGTVKGYHEIDLRFSEQGYIEFVNFKDGEKVVEGDIIASVDQREALLKLQYAKNELEKNKLLFDLGSVTEIKLEQARLEYESARLDYEKTNLIAVNDGYIGNIEVERGDFVTPNDQVGSFVNLSDAYVEFGVIEKDVANVRVGQPVTMVVDSYPRDTFSGEIESISPIVEGRARTFKVKARVTNEDEKLKAGMFGRIAVEIYEKTNALIIPSAAFKKKGDEYLVYVIHPDKQSAPEGQMPGMPDMAQAQQDIIFGTVEIRPIQIAYTTPDAVEIKAGLDENEMIVADIQQDLEEKSRVEVTEVQENIF